MRKSKPQSFATSSKVGISKLLNAIDIWSNISAGTTGTAPLSRAKDHVLKYSKIAFPSRPPGNTVTKLEFPAGHSCTLKNLCCARCSRVKNVYVAPVISTANKPTAYIDFFLALGTKCIKSIRYAPLPCLYRVLRLQTCVNRVTFVYSNPRTQETGFNNIYVCSSSLNTSTIIVLYMRLQT